MNKVVACTNKMPVQHDLARRKLHESILTMHIPGTPSILPRYSFHASAASRRTTLRLTRPSRLLLQPRHVHRGANVRRELHIREDSDVRKYVYTNSGPIWRSHSQVWSCIYTNRFLDLPMQSQHFIARPE